MAYEASQPLKESFVAAADLSAKQYRFVEMVAGGDGDQVNVCDAVTDVPIGVLQNKPRAGEEAEVVIIGITKISSNAALSRGDQIGTSADGQAAVYAAGTDTTKRIVGQVLLGSGGADVLATAVIDCAAPQRGA